MAKLFKLAIEEIINDEAMSDIIDNDGIDLSKDKMAIEETSGKLNDAIKTQSDLTEQLESNKQIDTPTENDIENTEVAIESVIAKLGVSREEYGLHAKSTRSFSVSQEGIVEIIKNIGRTIMNLVNKIIIFFKKLFNKIKLKLGNYKSKIQEMKEKLYTLSKSDKCKDATACNNAAKDIEDLNLVNCALYAPSSTSAIIEIPRLHINSISVCNKLVEWISARVDDSLQAKDVDWKESIKKAIESGKYDNVGIDNSVPYILDNEFSVFYLGSTKNTMCFIEVNYYFGNDSAYPSIDTCSHDVSLREIVGGMIKDSAHSNKWAVFNSGLFKHLTERILKYKSTNYNEIILCMEQCANGVSNLVDDGSTLFDNIASIQKKLADLTTKINKNASKVGDDNSTAAVRLSNLAKNIKAVAVDACGSMSKTYFSTIRDYLVIGNVLIKHFG